MIRDTLILFTFFTVVWINIEPVQAFVPSRNELDLLSSTYGTEPSKVLVPKFDTVPIIDGRVEEDVWNRALVLRDFIQIAPGDNIPPSKSTEVYIGYDEFNLYIAFKCWDDREKITATVAQRDNVLGDDNVQIWLDTYNDRRRAYFLAFNPFGIQQDGIFTEGVGTDYNVDLQFIESKGVIEDWGWSVEAKIPFSSLRYKVGEGQYWGFNTTRSIKRLNDEVNSWAPIRREIPGLLSQFGQIGGFDEVQDLKVLEIIPTLTFKQTGTRTDPARFSNSPIEPDFGVTFRYSIAPNISLDATINPDFADVEADAPVVEVNQRFPIFFPEKRPFFLEGIEIFQTPIQGVYTRRIENPDFAMKLTGKIRKYSFGIFGGIDNPLSNPHEKKAHFGVVRLKRDFGDESSIGLLATSYHYPEKHNNVGGADLRLKVNKNSFFRAQILGSTSRNFFYDPNTNTHNYQTGNGFGIDYQYSFEGKNYSWGVGGNGSSRNFRTDLGFNSRENSMHNSVFGGMVSDPKPDNFIIRRRINVSLAVRHDFSGRLQEWSNDWSVGVNLKGNTNINAGAFWGGAKIYEDEFGPKRNSSQVGAFFGDPERSAFQYGSYMTFYKRINDKISVSSNLGIFINNFDYDFGGGPRFPRVSPAAILIGNSAPLDPGEARGFDVGFYGEFKPTQYLTVELAYNKSNLTRNDTGLRVFDSNIFQFRSSYKFSRSVGLNTRVIYNTLDGRILGQYTFAWTPRPGRALYIGYNDTTSYRGYPFGQPHTGFLQLSRTFFIKTTYLFRIKP